MRYVQLRAFHYVAICGGFSRAADTLCLTQPAVSDQVRKLEEDYDVLLFNRHKKHVTPTALGNQLLEITHRMFETEQQAQDLLSESRVLRSGTLRIMADSALHLLHILGSFRKRYPGITVSVRTGNTEEVMAALRSYTADVGVLGEVPANRDFNVLELGSTPIVAFASANHDIVKRNSITLAELAALPLVLRERGSKTREKLERLAAARGVRLEAVIEAEGREAVREIVASGAGIGVVSTAEFGHDNRLRQIPLEGETLHMDEALICLRERSGGKLIQAFFAVASELLTAANADKPAVTSAP